MQLYQHQQKIIDEDPKKCGLFLSTGGGKTLTALSLAQGKTLVICPKTTRDDMTWERNLQKLGKNIPLTVISKEDLKRDWKSLPVFDTVIVDEVHTVCGVQPDLTWSKGTSKPRTSQVFEACISFLKKHPPTRLYLLTATPIRSPMSVYGLACLLDRQWNFYEFRSTFYVPVKINRHERWLPKKDAATQVRLGLAVQKLGYTGRLSDWVDVPEQTPFTRQIPLSDEQKQALKEIRLEYPDPLVLVGKRHQIEQGILTGDEFNAPKRFSTGKLEAIEDYYLEFGKILVFAKYTAQIDMIHDYFMSKDVSVYVLDGRTKDRKTLIETAEARDNCIVIAQCSVSAGYELPSFRCTVYASESYSFVDHEQSKGRTLRINNLQKNLYVYLVCGEIDKAVRNALSLKQDFSEKIYATRSELSNTPKTLS